MKKRGRRIKGKIHYRDHYGVPFATACGIDMYHRGKGGGFLITRNKKKVTCKRCKKMMRGKEYQRR